LIFVKGLSHEFDCKWYRWAEIICRKTSVSYVGNITKDSWTTVQAKPKQQRRLPGKCRKRSAVMLIFPPCSEISATCSPVFSKNGKPVTLQK
jgi:hypothetical protein